MGLKNRLTTEEVILQEQDPEHRFDFHSHDGAATQQDALDHLIAEMNIGQKAAYDKVVKHFEAYTEFPDHTEGEPLRMFLSGEGGTGKSHVLHAIIKHARIKWGRTAGCYGPVLVVAPTGNAAYNVGGYTWHSYVAPPAPICRFKMGVVTNYYATTAHKRATHRPRECTNFPA